jgi:hypothetical protein
MQSCNDAPVFLQEERKFIMHWSSGPSAASQAEIVPAWHLRHPFVAGYSKLLRHTCCAVPIHDPAATQIPLDRQIQLICLYTYIRDERVRQSLSPVNEQSTFGSYLVRVTGSGNRMPVDMQRHTLQHASSSLFYDVSFNTLYASSYKTTSFSGKKHVLKIPLTASYNFWSERSSTHPSSEPSNVFYETRFSMPMPPASSVYPSYPVGMSFDLAVVDPLKNYLFFYVPTLWQPNSLINLLYYIPPPEREVLTGERDTGRQQPILVESDASTTVQRTLSSISIAYGVHRPPSLIFTISSGLYVRLDPFSSTYHQLGTCTQCPMGKTSDDGAASVSDCYCNAGTFFDGGSGLCKPVRGRCVEGEYLALEPTPYNDRECLPCPVCPLGYYRDPTDCVPSQRRDPMKPILCLVCDNCPPGMYIDTQKCRPDGSRNHDPARDCRSCDVCDPMQTVVGTRCTGLTTYNTQSCQKCTGTCPMGTYIAPQTERCNGRTMGPPDAPFDPVTECIPCDECDGLRARVGGCTGKFRNDWGECVACNVCAKGQFIAGSCSVGSNASTSQTTCASCPACPEGMYESKPCSGWCIHEHTCM